MNSIDVIKSIPRAVLQVEIDELENIGAEETWIHHELENGTLIDIDIHDIEATGIWKICAYPTFKRNGYVNTDTCNPIFNGKSINDFQ